jgi:MFS superfamily sulfate permease-like transporter
VRVALPKQQAVREWLPKSVLSLKGYDRSKFLHDLVAGITVGLVALPLAMAFAIASGVPPQAGLYCAIVAGFLVSAFGGSLTQIGGPTGAFVPRIERAQAIYPALPHPPPAATWGRRLGDHADALTAGRIS